MFTEFYCDAANGSNLNSGSDAGTSVYTSTNGSWSTVTNLFTPTDGTNPATASPGVTVGQFASVYIDGAAVAVYVGRVTNVVNAVNGAITVSSSAKMGTAPTTSATTRTIKVGGCWKGPNGTSWFPFSIAMVGTTLTDSGGDLTRINLKNNAIYQMTGSANTAGFNNLVVQGYSSSVDDSGIANIDNSSGATLLTIASATSCFYKQLKFSCSSGSGSTSLLSVTGGGHWFRCVFTGSRGSGINLSSTDAVVRECEAYDNNKGNGASNAGFVSSSNTQFFSCISHDNTGSNSSGFLITTANGTFNNCIADTNGGSGITTSSNPATLSITNCDFYNNGGDGIVIGNTVPIIINCNFIKNTGKAINVTGLTRGGLVSHNGYGSGTQANGSADSLSNIYDDGTAITYASNVTPWVDPANGDFRIDLVAANFAGRGAFTETAPSYSGTIGYPDVGAAQSLTGGGGTFGREISAGVAQ